MPTVVVEPTRVRARSFPRGVVWLAAAIAVCLFALAASSALHGPRFVAQLTVANPSPYSLEVQVAGRQGDDWMLLGSVAPKSSSAITEVVEQGDTWVFHVQAQGVSGGEFAISRAALVQSGWRVTVPDRVIARLRSHEIPESPTGG